MGFEQMIQFMRQVQGKVNTGLMTSLQTQSNPQHVAFVKQLQKELSVKDSLTKPLNELKVVVFDFETTGFHPEQGDEILSIGAVKVKEGKVLLDESFYSLVRYDQKLTDEIKMLTGLQEEELQQAPMLSNVLVQFFKYMQSDILVAHHATHERKFIQHASWREFRSRFQHRIVDTSFLIRLAEPHLNLIQLEECCEHCGIEVKDRHHALSDAKMTAKLWNIYVEKVQKLGLRTLEEVYSHLPLIDRPQ
ncbi:exonuclease domain-containing protein [Bacillus solimangrovi]|uniref:DNA polymerase III subunit epsilon n=1 Tax=Bacillus solimangrovi TaxID=1305675 RepID=A0A1E5LJP2_9BACI|nr:exonuclease domain-containing protein [Bacillus solimangrovi]OEH94307.1 DNA polymerase III subunit epsilon [Bacillus solimangrovi]